MGFKKYRPNNEQSIPLILEEREEGVVLGVAAEEDTIGFIIFTDEGAMSVANAKDALEEHGFHVDHLHWGDTGELQILGTGGETEEETAEESEDETETEETQEQEDE